MVGLSVELANEQWAGFVPKTEQQKRREWGSTLGFWLWVKVWRKVGRTGCFDFRTTFGSAPFLGYIWYYVTITIHPFVTLITATIRVTIRVSASASSTETRVHILTFTVGRTTTVTMFVSVIFLTFFAKIPRHFVVDVVPKDPPLAKDFPLTSPTISQNTSSSLFESPVVNARKHLFAETVSIEISWRADTRNF
ncbi:hypothetical protein TWF173_009179 [Orbilia oligospora]|nr:hypothetical protein TWF173_009179 [Orbilia oligospora]